MAISRELFLAILAMDSYNRGYDAGVDGLDDAIGTAIGAAQISAATADSDAAATAFGFFGIAYTVGAGVEGIDAGTTIISYRVTDRRGLSS